MKISSFPGLGVFENYEKTKNYNLYFLILRAYWVLQEGFGRAET